jgi:hypothetical protein
VFVHSVDSEAALASDRKPLTFTEVYLGHVDIADFRKNTKSELGTDNPQVPDSCPGPGNRSGQYRHINPLPGFILAGAPKGDQGGHWREFVSAS